VSRSIEARDDSSSEQAVRAKHYLSNDGTAKLEGCWTHKDSIQFHAAGAPVPLSTKFRQIGEG
jgi:hypothetical protein